MANTSAGGIATDLPDVNFEIKDHSGNVRLVFSEAAGTTAPAPPEAKVINQYYAFGGPQPFRNAFTSTYRMGFNGQERDDNVMPNSIGGLGLGKLNTAKFWMYNPHYALRWNMDPVTDVENGPYAVFGNNPVLYVDPNGDLFGIKGFGSSAAQRDAAKSFAKVHGGKVHNLWLKGINVTYTESGRSYSMQPEGGSKVGVLDDFVLLPDRNRTQYFTPDGSEYKSVIEGSWDYSDAIEQDKARQAYRERMTAWEYQKNQLSGLGHLNDGPIQPVYPDLFLIPLPPLFKAFNIALKASESTVGGLNLFKFGAQQTTRTTGWKTGDYMLHLPNKGSPMLNWKANYGALRREMRTGNTIFDSYRFPNGNLIPSPSGTFLNAERYILKSRGWIYNSEKGAWTAPVK